MNTEITSSNMIKGAVIGGFINAIINGLKYWFSVRHETGVRLTHDLISSTENTVFSGAVPLATSLAFFLTSIAFSCQKFRESPPTSPGFFYWR